MNFMFSNQSLIFSQKFKEWVKIIQKQDIFGELYYTIFIPSTNQIEQVKYSDIQEESPKFSKEYFQFIACLSMSQKMLDEGVILAPVGSSLIPLPHQIACLTRVIAEEKPRYLIADEVGLGKTIEAGLIYKELKLRRVVEKVLILCPKSLVIQWVSEMKNHFNEDFRLILSEEISRSHEIFNDVNIWKMFPLVVCSFDSVKPIEKRIGWKEEQIEKYNQQRFEKLLVAGWDLVIIDEAHKVAGATEGVSRNKLAKELTKAVPYVLLLTATPHQGKRDGFLRLMRLLDEEQFPNQNALSIETIAPYVIRTEKRKAIYADGRPLFTPRETRLIRFEETSSTQEKLYQSVEEYVKRGYKKMAGTHVILFLMVLQRILSSSTYALRRTLEKRLYYIHCNISGDMNKKLSNLDEFTEDEDIEQDLCEMQKDVLISDNEVDLLTELIENAKQIEASEVDTKAKQVLELIYQCQREEENSSLKVLIFTEFIATQEMLNSFFSSRGFQVVILNGQFSIEDRSNIQSKFQKDAEILISTEAGGEGINLQFCHIVINYDIPWNPMRLEQRIGRVDRIGQKQKVRAFNLVKKGSIEEYIQSLLEEKLTVILQDFGVSKISDVLDSNVSDETFNQIYREALLNPDLKPKLLNIFMEQLKEAAKSRIDISQLMVVNLDKNTQEENMRKTKFFEKLLESLVVNYLNYFSGSAIRGLFGWNLVLPDGTQIQEATFQSGESSINHYEMLGLNHPFIASLLSLQCPILKPEISTKLFIKSLPKSLHGTWSFWILQIKSFDKIISRYIPIYLDSNFQFFVPSSNRIWEKLCDGDFEIKLAEKSSQEILTNHYEIALNNAKSLFEKVRKQYEMHRQAEVNRKLNILNAKKKAVERIGIENIRKNRIREIDIEINRIKRNNNKPIDLIPNFSLILLTEVEGNE